MDRLLSSGFQGEICDQPKRMCQMCCSLEIKTTMIQWGHEKTEHLGRELVLCLQDNVDPSQTPIVPAFPDCRLSCDAGVAGYAPWTSIRGRGLTHLCVCLWIKIGNPQTQKWCLSTRECCCLQVAMPSHHTNNSSARSNM